MMKYPQMKSREVDVAVVVSNLERHQNRPYHALVRRADLVEMHANTLKKMALKNPSRMAFSLLVRAVSLVAALDAWSSVLQMWRQQIVQRAKGRLGKTACERFTSTGARKEPEVQSEGITSEEESVGEPQKKKQRLETKVLVGQNQQIEVVLNPSKGKPSRRPDVSPARPGPRWSTAHQSTVTAGSRKSSRVQ